MVKKRIFATKGERTITQGWIQQLKWLHRCWYFSASQLFPPFPGFAPQHNDSSWRFPELHACLVPSVIPAQKSVCLFPNHSSKSSESLALPESSYHLWDKYSEGGMRCSCCWICITSLPLDPELWSSHLNDVGWELLDSPRKYILFPNKRGINACHCQLIEITHWNKKGLFIFLTLTYTIR